MLPKSPSIRSNALRKSAAGEACTFNIADVCSYDNAQTVLCHLPGEGHGMGYKTDDLYAAFGCAACHAWIDGNQGPETERLYYINRAWKRTMRRWVEMGLVAVKGAACG